MGAALLAALSASAGNDIVVKAGDTVKLFTETKAVSKTYNFEDGTLQGWTTIDANNDGRTWLNSFYHYPTEEGHNNSSCFAFSEIEPTAGDDTSPDDYLVSPMKVKAKKGTYISFYATAAYYADHFGVAVSTAGNTDAKDFKTIDQWTFGAKGAMAQAPDKAKRSVVKRGWSDWQQYQVDLSDYADKEIWIAIRHFNCYDMPFLLVDDITIGNYMDYCSWKNDNTRIGLPKKGEGPAEFVALNDQTGIDPVAHITTQFPGEDQDSFTLTVQPMDAGVAPVEDITVKHGEEVDVAFTLDEGVSIWWTNDNTSIGLVEYGQFDFSFTAVNTTGKDQVANFTVHPFKRLDDGLRIYGRIMTFKVTVTSNFDNDIVVKAGELVRLPNESKFYDFEDGTLQGWTTINEDGDGVNWANSRNIIYGRPEAHISEYCAFDGLYDAPGDYLVADDYLVAPMKVKAKEDTYISFYASTASNSYKIEHFGVAVSTAGNTDAEDFETIAEWDYGEAEWQQYKVDLSKYAGDEIWVAIRHCHTSFQHYFVVDDITIGNYINTSVKDATWVCDNPAIGLPASGSGLIEFVALNDVSGNDVVANITIKHLDEEEYSYTVTVQPLDDEIAPVDDIKVKDGDDVEVPLFVNAKYDYDFEDGTLQGWTTFNGNGNDWDTWMHSKDYTDIYAVEFNGHNSKYCVVSLSYDTLFECDLTPDNYLVAPHKFKATANSYISFYASALDEVKCAEHFGVAVSKTGNTLGADFSTIAEWTFGEAVGTSQAKAKSSVVKRTPSDWVQYRVDLSNYAGKEIWIALRHFDCTGQSALTIDDITIGNVMPVVGEGCEWTNDNPAIGLAASGEGTISFTAVNKNKEDQVANITAVPFKPAGDGKVYGKPTTFKITVSGQESGLTEISKDDNSEALYFTVSGIQVPADRLLPGIYLRLRGDKADKVIVK